MKVVNQSYEILEYAPGKELKHLERIGRMCYKSEDKISEDDTSAKEFIKTLMNDRYNHSEDMAILEHAGLIFRVNNVAYEELLSMAKHYNELRGQPCQLRFTRTSYPDFYMVSGDMRAWFDTFDMEMFYNEQHYNDEFVELPEEMVDIFKMYPEIFEKIHDRFIVNRRMCAVAIPSKDLKSDSEKWVHQTVSVRFVTGRNVSEELSHYSLMSFVQEKESAPEERFSGEITFVDPLTCIGSDSIMWELDDATLFDMKVLWERSCLDAEKTYMALIESGASPQIARSVLPDSTKTEFVATGNLSAWKRFFCFYCGKTECPAISELAISLRDEFDKKGWLL